MRIIERLNNKKIELEERLSCLYQGGSQRRETLQYKIKKIKDLIEIYQSSLKTSVSVNLSEAEQILSQQIGFKEQKETILNNLKIEDFCQKYNVRRHPQILCLVGPSGVGKTTFAQIFARSLKKKIFSITLGGLSDSSILLGTSENSSGTEIGQLTRSLVETKSSSPLILLEEIDKVAFAFQSSIHGILTAVLDPVQNHEILDYYLEVKLDFSQVIFVVTANEVERIPTHLRSRMLIVELCGYNKEQKRKIAEITIQK
jgi:ATP-dependent Lon protease